MAATSLAERHDAHQRGGAIADGSRDSSRRRGGLRRQRDLDASVVGDHAEPKVDRS